MTTTEQVKRGRDLETDRAHDAFWETLDGLNDDIADLRDKLAQEQLLNAANTATIAWLKEAFLEARALGCKAAWAVAMPGSTGGNHTGFPDGVGAGHIHDVLNEDAREILAGLAALDRSGYAPQAADVGTLIPGTGTGEPPVPPQYAERPA